MSMNTNNTNFNTIVQQLNDRTQVQLQQSHGRPVSFYDNYRVNINNNHNNINSNGFNGTGAALNGYPSYVQPSAPLVQPEDDVDDNDDVNNDNNDNISERNDNNKFNNLNGDKNYLIHKTHSRSQSVLSNHSQPPQQQPSLAYCLNTTVPQNIAASTIAGRHAPTRNSLRHSRMIVMNRSGKAEKYKRKGLLIQHQGLGRALVGIQTLLGSILCIVALWLLLWAPNLPRKDNSYWSALPLLISGIIGLLLIGCCKHKTYKNVKHTCAQSSKILSVFLTLVAGFACIAATVFAIIHIVTLSQMICEPEFTLNTTCVCRSASIQKNVTSTSLLSPSVYFHYIDLSCPEVDGILTYILIFSATANCIGIIVTFSYLYIHWKSRYLYSYSSVLTNDNSNSICNNT